MSKKSSHGFTIVELLFATAIFSAVLLLCLSALVQIGRMYYKGVTTSQTQQSARALLDELSQAMQFSSADITPPKDITGVARPELAGPIIPVNGSITNGAVGYFCIGATRYTFAMDRQQDNTNDVVRKTIKHAIWADEPGACSSAAPASLPAVDLTADAPNGATDYKGRNLLGDNMRLTRLVIQQPSGFTNGSVWQIKLTVAYGEDDLLIVDPTDSSRRYCKGAQVGTQFCAFSELSTIIKRRVQ